MTVALLACEVVEAVEALLVRRHRTRGQICTNVPTALEFLHPLLRRLRCFGGGGDHDGAPARPDLLCAAGAHAVREDDRRYYQDGRPGTPELLALRVLAGVQ